MKKMLTTLGLVILTSSVFSQTIKEELKDDLIPKAEQVLSKYIPMHNGTYLYKLYVMPSNEVEKQLAAFKAELYKTVDKEPNVKDRELAKKDADYRARKVLGWYTGLYGMDSLGMKNLEKVTIEHKGDTNFVALFEEARKKAFVKKMDLEQREALLAKVYADPDLDNEALYRRSAAYRSWLGDYVTYIRNTMYKSDTTLGYEGMPIVQLKVVQAEFPAGEVKDNLLFQYTGEIMKMIKDSTEKEKAYRNFMASSKNEAQRKSIEEIYANDRMMNSRAQSPIFNFPDVEGNMVSLTSLRGKYVYIDVWATWCGPCKAEIPFLQKIEHDYGNKNIHFVSLSVDRMKDQEKWKAYVSEHDLGGIQLMADQDFSSDFIKRYNINAIPRFILIDPQGYIISGDAYRPSDPKLREQLDQLLN
ncbi:MAG: TlpA family protein disulfide reductase [Sphingobacterium sp.]|jgi:thiol-disulfide isomerase/thioredoxin|nr:TlpA family protein disulfide reductase [Sphingobacterium sp.]